MLLCGSGGCANAVQRAADATGKYGQSSCTGILVTPLSSSVRTSLSSLRAALLKTLLQICFLKKRQKRMSPSYRSPGHLFRRRHPLGTVLPFAEVGWVCHHWKCSLNLPTCTKVCRWRRMTGKSLLSLSKTWRRLCRKTGSFAASSGMSVTVCHSVADSPPSRCGSRRSTAMAMI